MKVIYFLISSGCCTTFIATLSIFSKTIINKYLTMNEEDIPKDAISARSFDLLKSNTIE